MVRSLLLVIVLAAGCGNRAATGPAWPAPSTTVEDGGESIAPRNVSVASSLEKAPDAKQAVADDDGDDEATPGADAAGKPAAATGDNPGASEPAQPTVDDVIFTDEIIIDIDDE